MAHYFEKNQWEPFAYQRLNELIEAHQSDSQVKLEDKAYVVFDFDNTSIIGDVEDNLMIYMLDNLLYKLNPEQFYEILHNDLFEMDRILVDALQEATLGNLVDDIIEAYTWLWTHYLNEGEASSLTLREVKATLYYQAFQAKLRYYYVLVNGKFTRQAGKPWLTYWFQGYTPEELTELTKDMIAHAREAKAENIVYQSPKELPGKTGVIQSSFQAGLAIPPEMIALYKALQDNGIVTYVVSASPIDVVQTAASDYDFNVPSEQVIGMYYELDDEGRIKAHMKAGYAITKKEGKTETILSRIAPKHNNLQPIALFGDSMGDYHMMTQLQDVTLNVLFNCLNQDQTKELKEKAREQYNHLDANIVVQGRDENTLTFIPDTRSKALGHDTLSY